MKEGGSSSPVPTPACPPFDKFVRKLKRLDIDDSSWAIHGAKNAGKEATRGAAYAALAAGEKRGHAGAAAVRGAKRQKMRMGGDARRNNLAGERAWEQSVLGESGHAVAVAGRPGRPIPGLGWRTRTARRHCAACDTRPKRLQLQRAEPSLRMHPRSSQRAFATRHPASHLRQSFRRRPGGEHRAATRRRRKGRAATSRGAWAAQRPETPPPRGPRSRKSSGGRYSWTQGGPEAEQLVG